MIKRKSPNAKIPSVAIAGGFANETQIYKALAIGAPYMSCVAVARAPITAAMKAQWAADVINNNEVTPAMLNYLGFPKDKDPDSLTKSEAFLEYDALMRKYNHKEIPACAIGVYTYFTSKLGIGLKQLLAGARKFKLNLLDREDIAAISQRAIDVCNHWDLGIKSQEELDMELVKKEIYSGIYD
jgi:hypothetical protein